MGTQTYLDRIEYLLIRRAWTLANCLRVEVSGGQCRLITRTRGTKTMKSTATSLRVLCSLGLALALPLLPCASANATEAWDGQTSQQAQAAQANPPESYTATGGYNRQAAGVMEE